MKTPTNRLDRPATHTIELLLWPTVEMVTNLPETSGWLNNTLASALGRDPVDALKDAEILTMALKHRLDRMQEGIPLKGLGRKLAGT